MENVEDVAIIGAGSAGYTAAIYTAREEFKTLVITGIERGGQLMLTTMVENYPGFPDGIMGPELMEKFADQAKNFGARFVNDNVTDIDFNSKPFKISVGSDTYYAKSIILALGSSAKWLNLLSEKKMIGHGVSSCATCMPPSSLIVANASTTAIDQIMPKTRVLTHDGTFKPVVELMQRHYSGDMVTFKTRVFRSELTSLTPNHLVLVRTFEKGKGVNCRKIKWSEPFWVPAGELNNKNIVLYPIPQEQIKSQIIKVSEELGLSVEDGYAKLQNETHSSHRIKNITQIDSDFARLIGYYLSEGFAHSRGVSFAFNTKEWDYVKDCVDIIKQKYQLDCSVKTEGSVLRITVSSKILSMLFEKLFGKYSHSKKLPHRLVLLDKTLQKEIIKGMWRGDGCLRKEDFIITTSSRELVEQLKIILLRQGILPGVEKRRFETLKHSKIETRNVEFKHNVYQIVVGGPWLKNMSEIVGENHPRVDSRHHICNHGWIDEKYAMLPIKEVIHKNYNGPVYNIAVDVNNTYTSTNSIVHNCDGAFFKNKDVIVVGGGDTAMTDAIFLTKFCNNVTVVHRRDKMRASKIMQDRAKSNPKIKFLYDTVIEDVIGDVKITGAKLKNLKTNEIKTVNVDGIFVAIGHSPNTSFLKGKIKLDDLGYIVTKEEVKTNIEGVFAAGDVVDRFYRQAITAAGSGAKAAIEARDYLLSLEHSK